MHGEYKIPGGKLVVVDLDVMDDRISTVEVSGDFFLEPDAALGRIRAAITGAPIAITEIELTERIAAALNGATMLGLSAEGIAIAVRRALGQEPE